MQIDIETDGSSVQTTRRESSLTGSVAGALLDGGVGAMVGMGMGNSITATRDFVRSVGLRITVRDPSSPFIRVWSATSALCLRIAVAIAFAEFTILPTPLIARPAPVPNLAVESGSYSENMLIGSDPATHTVSGYYEAYSGQKQFSCVFALTGKLRGRSTPIQTFYPDTPSDVIRGEFVKSTRSRFTLLLSAEHDGCWNVQHFSDKQRPVQFDLRVAYPWISVAVIKRTRAYLFNAINSGPRRAFLIKGDGVGVRTVRGQWLQIDFIGGRKPISGWIRQSDVYPSLNRP